MCDETDSTHQAVLMHNQGSPRKSTGVFVWLEGWTSHFSSFINQQWLSWKWTASLSLQRKSLNLLPLIKFKLSCENYDFAECVSTTRSLITSQYVRTVLIRLEVILMNIIFWSYIIKCVNIWKIYITQWTNIFQMINAWCYKIMNERKIHLKCI